MKLSRALRIQRRDVVALVGGGGKTSAMFRLGDELAAQGWRVITTTSTHIGADQIGHAPHVIILSDQMAEQPNLPSQLLTHSPTLLVKAINRKINKAEGIEPDVINHLAATSAVDALINEADGARTFPLKAPADHEPVIPQSTTLVVPMVGIDVLGQPLDDKHVHRPGQIAALSGATAGQPITLQHIAAVLTHPQGGLKDVPTGSRVVPLINKVETEAQTTVARRLADLLLTSPHIDAVAIGAVQNTDPVGMVKSRVAVVVLAAGESRRFGQLKQLFPWGDKGTLLTHAVDVALASGAEPVVVVLGCQADACRSELSDRPVKVVVNVDWAAGQSTSVRAGLAALPDNVGATLFHLVDQPCVTPAVIEALVQHHAITLAPVVWPEYQGRRGNPVLFDRATFPELQQLTGDTGGKPVLMAYARAGTGAHIVVDEPGILMDIDVPTDIPTAEGEY